MSEIREIRTDELQPFVNLQGDAYPGMDMLTRKAKEEALPHYRIALEDPRTHAFGYFRDRAMLGGIILYDYQMNLFGKKLLVGGAGSLGVSLDHKKEHIARDLMKFFFDHYRKLNSPLALLWPFQHDFYRKMGCGYGTRIYENRINPVTLSNQAGKNHIRELFEADLPKINDCYNRYVDRTHGMIEEIIEGRIRRYKRREKMHYVGFVDNEQELRGYLTFAFVKGEADSFIDNHMVIDELIYESPSVLAEFLAYLHSQADQISLIILRTPDAELFNALNDPRSDRRRVIPPVYHESHAVGLGIMYRFKYYRPD